MNWKIIIPWVIAIGCGVFILVSVFKPSPKGDKYLDLYIAEKDQRIKEIQEFANKETQRANAALAESNYKDSLLQIRSKTNIIRYEKVPVTVNSFTQPELVSAIESEFGQ